MPKTTIFRLSSQPRFELTAPDLLKIGLEKLESSVDEITWMGEAEFRSIVESTVILTPPAQEAELHQDRQATLESATRQVSSVADSVTSLKFSSIGDTITDYIVPKWVKMMPDFITKLQNELSMAPGSLAEEIWNEAHNPEINPEIVWDASVRVSRELCTEEKDFLRKRKVRTTAALARYLDIPESDIHPEDVPVIAMCGSGGGLRALVAGTSSFLSAQEAGLFDCVTYTAGVSGSCWLQTIYYSSIGQQNHHHMIRHLKNRLGVHLALPPAALALLGSAPTNKFLLSGLVEKLKGVPDADFGIVDLYGVLLAARLLVPKGDLNVDDYDLKISNQRKYTDLGAHPLPIYTAVRHEIPLKEQVESSPAEAARKAKREAWFQWFEFSPYEFWCEELEAGIPTWAIGRTFNHGRNVWHENGLALPEIRVPLMMGIWGSAFCATLSHYYKEIRPLVKGLAGFGGIDQLIVEREDDLVKLHPIDPATIPNFALGMEDQLPLSCPQSIHSATHLQLMDAGMSNNLPIYPLLRPGRDVDVLIAFDASADVKADNWLKVADSYARQRGIKGWPIGAGWPSQEPTKDEVVLELDAAQAATPKEAADKLVQSTERSRDVDERTASKLGIRNQQAPQGNRDTSKDLSFCTVWVGTTEERRSEEEPPPSKRIEEDWQFTGCDGIALIYFPFVPNPKVEGVDPAKSEFMSTWNMVYTPEQIDKVVALARANFEEGKDQTKRTVKAVYERKKTKREEREKEEKAMRRRMKLRMGTAGRKGTGDHGDHFS
ncbi:hypothetical protein B0A49_00163 [Cryomyces minteri]|uniref:Lysophospholipase n=1 Tax=Cryomyces minteri TaxID=331657 RepID=A0A4U0Y3B2_9PEZI|nr:hypothetical protein B0A49_00163 [Cryomyces minteri]